MNTIPPVTPLDPAHWPGGPDAWAAYRIQAGNTPGMIPTHVDGIEMVLPDRTLFDVPHVENVGDANFGIIQMRYSGYRRVNGVRQGVDPWTTRRRILSWGSSWSQQDHHLNLTNLLDHVPLPEDRAIAFIQPVWRGEFTTTATIGITNPMEHEINVALAATAGSRVDFTEPHDAGQIASIQSGATALRGVKPGETRSATVPIVLYGLRAENHYLGTHIPEAGTLQLTLRFSLLVEARQWKLPGNSVRGPFVYHDPWVMDDLANRVTIMFSPWTIRERLAMTWYDGTPDDSSDDIRVPEPQP